MASPDHQDTAAPPSPGRLLLISNRLPISIKSSGDGTYQYSMSSGGLVAGLSGLSGTTTFSWYGWPGLEVPESKIGEITEQLKEKYNAHPIFISDELADRHYNGFANSILWPLFHYHSTGIIFDESAWDAYQQVNRLFAKAVVKDVQDGDIIWVHDYHLMLMPQMLREEIGTSRKDIKIGFFLHTPFPSSETYRILPVREALLRGLLHCDLIGFHTYDYCRHFLSSCGRILSLPTTDTGVEFEGRFAAVASFPIGIDPDKFVVAGKKQSVQDRIAALRRKFQGLKIIVGVDRLDVIKGVPQKLYGFKAFLDQHPEWIGKVCLVQVAVPSRENVEATQVLLAEINEIVGSVNGRLGSVDFVPVHFLYKSVDFEELVALYTVADACLITSTRDGMNLVCYEYVAAHKHDRDGVLILSEFAGAVQGLRSGSLVINPWHTEDVANAICEALTMPAEERQAKYNKLERFVFKYTSAWWGSSFLPELTRAAEKNILGAQA